MIKIAKTFSENYYGKHFDRKKEKLPVANGENRQALDFNLEGFKLDPIDVSDIQAVVDRASYYFERCADEGLRPGVASLCVWLGISRDRWQKWIHGAEFKSTHMGVCQKINGLFDAMMENYMQNGKINPVSGIFLLKNNHGYTDTADKPVDQKDSAVQEISMVEILKIAEGKK